MAAVGFWNDPPSYIFLLFFLPLHKRAKIREEKFAARGKENLISLFGAVYIAKSEKIFNSKLTPRRCIIVSITRDFFSFFVAFSFLYREHRVREWTYSREKKGGGKKETEDRERKRER